MRLVLEEKEALEERRTWVRQAGFQEGTEMKAKCLGLLAHILKFSGETPLVPTITMF